MPFYPLFSGFSVSPLFLFLLFLSAILVWWFSVIFLSISSFFFFFNVSCLCSRFLFCGHREVCIKCLIGKIILLLVVSYLHLPI